MPAAIFSGDVVKTLKTIMQLKDGVQMESGTDDPRSVAKIGLPGSKYYKEDTGQIFTKKDSGSSTNWILDQMSPATQYIENGDAEVDLTGWATYDDGAVAAPVDGTGGSPTVITLNQTTVSGEVLRGFTSFEIAKTAADAQGEGVNYDFNIDPVDQGKELRFSADYKTTANYVTDDIKVFVYDVGNANLITPTLNGFAAATSGNSITVDFTAAANSTQYRLIFHVTTTNALAYDLYFDNVQVTPTSQVAGAGITWNTQEFTGPGNFNVPAGVEYVIVEAVGGGGGGGGGGATTIGAGAGTGGAGGGASYRTFTLLPVTPLSSVAVSLGTAGGGGAGGTTPTGRAGDGGTGGDTSFGGEIVAKGGAGGEGAWNGSDGSKANTNDSQSPWQICHDVRNAQGYGAIAIPSGGAGKLSGVAGSAGTSTQTFSGGAAGAAPGGAGGPGGGGGASWYGAGGNGGSGVNSDFGTVGGTPAGTAYGAGGGGAGGSDDSGASRNGVAGGAGIQGYLKVIWWS